ncbi:uncharacterized protein TNCV_4841461 [Trichonephila clavipes]|uniref:Uncharacterized protein n=1 Tax=Trichonephila clavipes TaxID=2585209 RepID=A0A8X6WIT9_TRICX|nr:uncharacterized protein TNCV_4841461 [Trichonephila clavipes]
MPTSAIKDLLKKWEAARAMVLEWHPNQADVSRVGDLYNDNAINYFWKILKKREKQSTLDILFALETYCGYEHRSARESHSLPRSFKGRRIGHGSSDRALTRTASLSPRDEIPGTRTLTKKRQLFSG